MKKYLILFVSILSFTAFVGCSDDDGYTPPNYVTFGQTSAATSVLQDGDTSFEMTVYTANVTGTDRTVALNVLPSTTLNAETYSLPESVTIPANSNETTFTVELVDDNLANSGGRLVLSLGTMDEDFYTGNNLTLNVRRVCPFDVNNYVGTFAASEVFTAGTNEGFSFLEGAEFPVELAVNPDDASGNSLLVTDANGFIDGTVLTFDPASGSFDVTSTTPILGYPFVFTGSDTDTCNESLSFTGNLNATAESAGFGQYTVTLTKM